MSWKKIEDRLYTRYCVEIEKDDSITQNLMKQHDNEIKSQIINDFLERIKIACSMYTIGCSHSDNSLIYAHSDGTWHNLIEDIANQMNGKIEIKKQEKSIYQVTTCEKRRLKNRCYNDVFEYDNKNIYKFSDKYEFDNFINNKDAATENGKIVRLKENEKIESIQTLGQCDKVFFDKVMCEYMKKERNQQSEQQKEAEDYER